MTYARARKDRVLVQLTTYDADYYLKPLLRLDEAQRNLEAVLSDLPSSELHDFQAAVEEADAEVEELFQEEHTIEEAERLLHQLGHSIIQAKVARGDFDYRDIDQD